MANNVSDSGTPAAGILSVTRLAELRALAEEGSGKWRAEPYQSGFWRIINSAGYTVADRMLRPEALFVVAANANFLALLDAAEESLRLAEEAARLRAGVDIALKALGFHCFCGDGDTCWLCELSHEVCAALEGK